MAQLRTKKSVGKFMVATLVDWNQPQVVSKMQKNLSKRIKKALKSKNVQNNRINTFSVSTVNFHEIPHLKQRIQTENKVKEVFSEYAQTVNKLYQKDLIYNGDTHIYVKGFKALGLDEPTEFILETQHSIIDRVENKISEIVSNASVGIWDLPGGNEDRIILPNLVACFDSYDPDLDLPSLIDELLVANLARNYLPFSKEILEDAIVDFTQLKNMVQNYDTHTSIDPQFKMILRNFIGTISGLQESMKLFEREVSRIYEIAVDAFDYLYNLPSSELKQWAKIKNREIGSNLEELIENMISLISDLKKILRKLLINKGNDNIQNYPALLNSFIKVKTHSIGIRQWVYRFEDLPSFTTLENGIAYEQVEGEKYEAVSKDSLIEATKLFKLFKRGNSSIYALRGVDLRINQGDFIVIRGPSGSGKTTLLNILAGLDQAGRGAVFYKGINIMEMKDKIRTKLRRDNFSFIFQNYALIPHLTAFENTKVPLDLINLSKELAQGIQELLDDVGIGKYAEHKPALLSGGQMQRLGIARALISRPKVIFADEPTGDLDEETSIAVMDLLKKYYEETGVTIVLVTHDEKIAKYGNKQIYLRDGQVVNSI